MPLKYQYSYSFDANGNALTRNGQSIVWNKYNYPTELNGSATEKVTLSYDANNARWKQVSVKDGVTETTHYIGGLLEKVLDGTGVTRFRYYLYSQSNTAAIAVMSRNSDGSNGTYYVLDDHQQSPAAIRDANGTAVVNESFSAYGVRRNWQTWQGAAETVELTTSAAITRQGYTWQTALGNMGLNHMNGRVQDAITGIFLSADPYISEPLNTQNYNRYGYVYNNPLSLNDPSGFESCGWWDFFTGGTAHAVSAVTSTVSNWFGSGASGSGSSSGWSGGGGSSAGTGGLEEVVVTGTKSGCTYTTCGSGGGDGFASVSNVGRSNSGGGGNSGTPQTENQCQLMMLAQGTEESGYYTYGTPGDGAGQFGRPETINLILDVGYQWSRTGAADFGVGNISLTNGGYFAGHSPTGSHTTGLGFDVRPIRLDGAQLPTTWTSPSYDRVGTQSLVNMLNSSGQVRNILFNDPKITGVSPYKGHDNHLHVNVRSTCGKK